MSFIQLFANIYLIWIVPVAGFLNVVPLTAVKISTSSFLHLAGFSALVERETWTEEQQTVLLNP